MIFPSRCRITASGRYLDQLPVPVLALPQCLLGLLACSNVLHGPGNPFAGTIRETVGNLAPAHYPYPPAGSVPHPVLGFKDGCPPLQIIGKPLVNQGDIVRMR